MNILIVDDDVVSRRLLRAVLEAEHLCVFEAVDGVGALSTLAHDRIDAVITDILMPRLDGYRLCHEMRSNEQLRAIPVIMYSATYTSSQDEALALQCGADHFLRKPAPAPILLSTLQACLAQERPHAPPGEPPFELARLCNYSERLVAKLEERNVELEEAREELREANALLEWRVLRRTEELAAANEHLESFAAFIAHEIRAPLRVISGYARELEEDFAPHLPVHAQSLAHAVTHAVGQTEHLTEALMQFCQLGARPVRNCQVDLNAVVRSALRVLADECRRRSVEVVVQDLPACDGDPLLLEHVFLNLVANAIRFTRTRPAPRVEIAVGLRDDVTELLVRDNGAGFDMQHAALVFEPFQPLHQEAGFNGSSLGLSLVRNIVRRHGGSIRVESVVDQGTTFFFTLAGLSTSSAAPTAEEASACAPPAS